MLQLLTARVPLWVLRRPVKQCMCTSAMIMRYQKRICGPLLDRIDIHVEVPQVAYENLSDNRAGEISATGYHHDVARMDGAAV
jgi:predicted ATPase with chaperone activity